MWAAIVFRNTQQLAQRTSYQHLYAVMSFSYVGAMLCSNYALQYISYPAQVIVAVNALPDFLHLNFQVFHCHSTTDFHIINRIKWIIMFLVFSLC